MSAYCQFRINPYTDFINCATIAFQHPPKTGDSHVKIGDFGPFLVNARIFGDLVAVQLPPSPFSYPRFASLIRCSALQFSDLAQAPRCLTGGVWTARR